jgi:hypothetical protein
MYEHSHGSQDTDAAQSPVRHLWNTVDTEVWREGHLLGLQRCTCPSFRWRKTGTCKHIAAVRALVHQQAGA